MYPLICGHSSSELFHMYTTVTLIWATDNGCWVIAKASSLHCGLPALKALVYSHLASASQEKTINTSLLCQRLPSSSKGKSKGLTPTGFVSWFMLTLFHWSPNWFLVKLCLISQPKSGKKHLKGGSVYLWLAVGGERVPHGEAGVVHEYEAAVILHI